VQCPKSVIDQTRLDHPPANLDLWLLACPHRCRESEDTHLCALPRSDVGNQSSVPSSLYDHPTRTAIGAAFFSWVVIIFAVGSTDRLFYRLPSPTPPRSISGARV
jgi:hypothetical protein